MPDLAMPAVVVSAPGEDAVVGYRAVLPLRATTVAYLAGLLRARQAELGTRAQGGVPLAA